MRLWACLIPIGCMMLQAAENNISQTTYTIHEWGTFTSIADESGMALKWQPFGGPSDLPCFVHRFQIGYKATLAGTVRMETPVIYFYTPQPTTARVHVAFRNGYITEWYPAATQVARRIGSGSNPATGNVSRNAGIRSPRPSEPDSIEWPKVKIDPAATPKYPFEFETSHYYTARSVDSASLMAGGEKEKFLFYRGVGEFQPPIAVQYMAGDRLQIRNLANNAIPAVIIFQNANGKISYHLLGALNGEIAADIPHAEFDLNALQLDFENVLISRGLFPKEARAMVETWRDSWFEEGVRVFYITPANEIESILPLQIEPRPERIARVFVGRVEVITPERQTSIKAAIKRGDRDALEKYGRFLEPLAREFADSALMRNIFQKYLTLETACATGENGW